MALEFFKNWALTLRVDVVLPQWSGESWCEGRGGGPHLVNLCLTTYRISGFSFLFWGVLGFLSWPLSDPKNHDSQRRDRLLRFFRERKLTTNFFFSQTFRAPPGYMRAKSRDIPPKKFDFHGFEGRIELFGPHHFTWKTLTPLGNVRTKKFGFGFLFPFRAFPPSGNRAIFSTFWGDFLAQLHRKPGEQGKNNPLEKIERNPVETAP